MRSRGSDAARPGERELIDHIRRRLPAPPASFVVGPGDDAAVVVPERGAFQVFTTDALVEGVHFDRGFSSLADVGYKSIAVNVSDLAAMGAMPSAALLSFILPDWISTSDIDALLDGILEMAASARVAVAGGNLSRSPGPLIVDVTLTGHVRPRRILTRRGGKPGDALYVTGSIGAAAAGLEWLTACSDRSDRSDGSGPDGAEMAGCVARHRRPEPRLRAGLLLGRNRAASACMDLSDGLSDAVTQVAEASGCGAVIEAASLPVDPAALKFFEDRGMDPVTASLAGGDDFELLFAVPRKRGGRLRAVRTEARGLLLTRIGELTTDRAVVLARDGRTEPLPAGFSHF